MNPICLVPYTLEQVVSGLEHQKVEVILSELHGFSHGGAKESAEDIFFSLDRLNQYLKELTEVRSRNEQNQRYAEDFGGEPILNPEPIYAGRRILIEPTTKDKRNLEQELVIISTIVGDTDLLKWKYVDRLMGRLTPEIREKLLEEEEENRPAKPQNQDEREWKAYTGFAYDFRVNALMRMNLNPLSEIKSDPELYQKVKKLYGSLVEGAKFYSQELPEFVEGQNKDRIQIYHWHWRLLTNQKRGSWKFFKSCPELRKAYDLITPYDPKERLLSIAQRVLDRF